MNVRKQLKNQEKKQKDNITKRDLIYKVEGFSLINLSLKKIIFTIQNIKIQSFKKKTTKQKFENVLTFLDRIYIM